MKRSIIATLILSVGFAMMQVQAQSLDEVLQSHFEAVGQDKLAKVHSMKTSGSINQMGLIFHSSNTLHAPGKCASLGPIWD
ncbi:MAG: hypothetical protein R2794_13430 [Chitinophagales bacterium]